ncbi:hypothetical protein DFA_05212 [Cavenderia fasciculata]|uniref:Calcium-transporting ATPase n=1 Tax=Cavenderia fasciculata TaxID=261658 RepID=F4PNM9_CACFS|nr:uncharacterized protein DFA_05212 [Cavenderia fasciculata]EGG23082.1 hypothetical protein DFA_05212 [Cavenderia fasciculata]|eukprot:XP_004360933.1 hypothetical protein DFA_05212 [Cavenderia fasciculata]
MSILVSVYPSHEEDIGLHKVEDFTLDTRHLEDLVSIPKNPKRLADLGGVKGLADKLNVNLDEGLPVHMIMTEESNLRIKRYGRNILPDPPQDSLWSMIIDALKDETLIILVIAATISIILGALKWTSHDPKTGWIDGVAILVAVAIVTMVTSINNYKNQGRFLELNKKSADKQVKLFRGGQQMLVSIFDVLVGDVLVVDTGDIICGDGVFIEGHSLVCDESSLTGESDPVKKGSPENGMDPFLISGSMVQEGFGRMLVTAVGVNSLNGRIMMSLRTEIEDTPLQEKLGVLAERIGKFGLAVAALMILITVPKYFITKKVNDEPITAASVSDITQIVVGAITIVVVAVPEGLPLAVTMALAYGMLKMFKENNLVRNLASCETMGGATTICSDKTGTLTQNVMTVVAGHICKPFDDVDYNLRYVVPASIQTILTDGICVNSNAYEGTNSKGRTEVVGSKTEGALLQFTKTFGADYVEVRKRLHVEKLYPFSSARKRMGVLVTLDEQHVRLYVKGASERILEACDSYLDADGNIQPLGADAKEVYEKAIFGFASDTLRTIGLAYKDYKKAEYDYEEADEPNFGLTLVGILGIRDPLRPEVRGAVRQCQGAGIVVRMLTGDNIVTAENIARKCGILQPGDISMDSFAFNKMSEAELERVIPRLRVLARSSPLDKLRLVNKLKDMGEIVAVTGDGTNDSPALKQANVGFSMGISGTEVAIAASDVVLLDDNFASIVRAVLWGRNIYDSICKFLQFQLTINIVAVTVAFVGTIYGNGKSPLTGVQLLWINLIMDTMAALALATEPPTPDLLERPPTGKDSPLITRTMWRNIIGHAVFQLTVQFVLLYIGTDIYNNFVHEKIIKDSVRHYTIIFNTFVFMQLFNEINARVLGNKLNPFRGIFANPIYVTILFITVVIQVLFVTFGGEVTSTVPLGVYEWIGCVVTGFFSLVVGLLLRMIPIKEPSYLKNHGKFETSPLLDGANKYGSVD